MRLDEETFCRICIILAAGSLMSLAALVLLQDDAAFLVDGYTQQVGCESGCSLSGEVSRVEFGDSAVFLTLEARTPVDAVFFVGTKVPSVAAGDCVRISGSVQTYKGRQSIVANTIRPCRD